MGELLQYRFPGEEGPESLGGHAVGNLLIAAMTAVEDGDFEEAVRHDEPGPGGPRPGRPGLGDAARRSTPSCTTGRRSSASRRIAATSGIERVWLTPEGVEASADAVAAIAEADLIVIGPGSLFTSVLPSLLLPEIRDAVVGLVRAADLRLQRGDPARRDDRLRPRRPRRGARAARVERDRRHRPRQQPAVGAPVAGGAGRGWRADPAALAARTSSGPPRLVLDDLVDPDDPRHHDPARLAAAMIRIAEREAAPAGAARRSPGPRDRPASVADRRARR